MAPKTAPSHPPYVEIVKAAIVALKERSGSSLPAIKKYVAENYKTLPTGWEKVLSLQLKRLAAAGKLVKVGLPASLGHDTARC